MTITAASPSSRARSASSRKRASSEPRPGSTAWTRPPAATIAATRSGIRSAASGRTVSHSPSTSRGPNALSRGRDRPRSRSVTRSRTPSTATTSSSEPDGDRPALVEDHDPVADPLDLGQQVRVEDHRRAAVARRADDRADVGPADRVERRRRLVEEDRARARRAARRRARAAAASPSRSRRPGRPRDRPGRRGRGPRRRPAARLGGGMRASSAWRREDLAGAQPGLVAEELGQVADPRPRRAVAERRAEDAPRAATSVGRGRAAA